MPHSSLLLFLLASLSGAVKGKSKVKFDWDAFSIKTSCAIESLLPGGGYDKKANKSCVECFGQIATADKSEGLKLVRNCSSTHLPNITDHCSTELEEDTSFGEFWMGAKKCFSTYVKENDLEAKVQRDVRQLMKKGHKEHEFYNWEQLCSRGSSHWRRI